jgi:hypothetical protein
MLRRRDGYCPVEKKPTGVPVEAKSLGKRAERFFQQRLHTTTHCFASPVPLVCHSKSCIFCLIKAVREGQQLTIFCIAEAPP